MSKLLNSPTLEIFERINPLITTEEADGSGTIQ